MSFRRLSLRTRALVLGVGALLAVGVTLLALGGQGGRPDATGADLRGSQLSDSAVESTDPLSGTRSIGRIVGSHVLDSEVPRRMIIQSAGVDSRVVPLGLDEDGALEVPSNGSDIAWYEVFAKPGTGSNAVFAGHVDWARTPAVFADLEDVEAGDTILVEMLDGTRLAYVVSSNTSVNPKDPASALVMSATPEDAITLISCGGTWIPDEDKEYGGDYSERVVVQATLVGANPSRLGSSGGF